MVSITKIVTLLSFSIFLTLFGCRDREADPNKIHIDGSSTVYPITEAVVEEFTRQHPEIKVTVGLSGTGGGFKKFCRNDIDITNASRGIKTSEVEACQEAGVGYLEMSVAYDGLAVVVHPENNWAQDITVAELKKMWEPAAQGKITRWNQIRPEWPDAEIHLFGAGVSSGTYDYFTQVIVGESHSSRGDYTASEDDNVLVQGISTDRLALGFFGIAYYEENKKKLKLIPVNDEQEDNGKGPIYPTFTTVRDKSYAPLARPLFIYVNSQAATRPAVQTFIHFYLTTAAQVATEVGYIPLNTEEYQEERRRFDQFAQGKKQETTAENL